jgi:hypothetical protein
MTLFTHRVNLSDMKFRNSHKLQWKIAYLQSITSAFGSHNFLCLLHWKIISQVFANLYFNWAKKYETIFLFSLVGFFVAKEIPLKFWVWKKWTVNLFYKMLFCESQNYANAAINHSVCKINIHFSWKFVEGNEKHNLCI